MKQKLYILGLINALVIFAGTVFKVTHLPGAGILLTSGLIFLSIIYLPLALVNAYRAPDNRKNAILYIVTGITCLIVFISMLFKIMHWPYAGLLLTIAMPFPYIVFLPVFITVTSKNKQFSIINTAFVLLLLALNSVFSGLLALNTSKSIIYESYRISDNYNKIANILDKITVSGSRSAINSEINHLLPVIDHYQASILQAEGLTIAQWREDPASLRYPLEMGVSPEILKEPGDSFPGQGFAEGLRTLDRLLKEKAGTGRTVNFIPGIFYFQEPGKPGPDWIRSTFGGNRIVWIMISLDQLRINLLMMRT